MKSGSLNNCLLKLSSMCNSEAIKHVQAMFPKLSEAKVKDRIFTAPQVEYIHSTPG